MAWNVPAVFSAGAVLTAAKLNQIRDSLLAIGDPGTSYTTTWTGSVTNPAIGNGTVSAVYNQAGKRVWFSAQITMGTTTTYGSGAWSITLPVAPRLTSGLVVTGIARDTSAATSFPIAAEIQAGSTVVLRAWPTTAGNAFASITSAVPFTWASTDILTVSGSYEAA